MSEDSNRKIASEAFELIKLFSRVGQSIYGLFLLEVIWLLTLTLATKVAGESETPSLLLPILTSFNPPQVGMRSIAISAIASIGGIVLLVGWSFYSRLYHYVLYPTRIAIRAILAPLYFIAIILILVVNLPLLVITIPIEWFLSWWHKQAEKSKWRAAFSANNPDQDINAAWEAACGKVRV